MDNNTEHTEMSSKLDKLFFFFCYIRESYTLCLLDQNLPLEGIYTVLAEMTYSGKLLCKFTIHSVKL